MKKFRIMLLLTLMLSLFAGSLQAYAQIDPNRAVNPVFESVVVQANENTVTKRAFNGAIIELKNNELLLTFDNYTDVEDDSPGVISGKISQDGGRTWGESYLIQENIGVKNVMNQGIVRLKSGALALFFAKQDDSAHIYMYMIRSYDEGRTWDEPLQMTPLAGFQTTANDRAVVLSSGRIIIPLGGDTESIPGKVGAFTIYSDDEGETWQFGDFVNWTTGYPAEPVLVELKDHRLMILIRTMQGHIIKAYSEDEGETWGEPIITDLQSPYAPHMIKRIPDNGMGPLLLIWNNSPTEDRRPLTMAVSNDEGETWTNFLNLEPTNTGVYAYPSLTTYRDEVLITYYTINYLPDRVTYTLPLKLQIWKLADITAGTGFGNTTTLTTGVSSISAGETFKVKYGLGSVAERVYAQDVNLTYDIKHALNLT
ncbi:sialidase family protein [Paenibacillus eucommiae]|uniref:Sialidase-1 n=1 Tax=Paenibacillus eucommiae TaxID=1355755 RepID=A0ABS4J3U3_9BACL|nr:sialidase family protein [Paenibacillus eucommiae]MBP1994488.1 sialidase-1 [Paenibacillus eucommiae]